jgi:hypothetical protein
VPRERDEELRAKRGERVLPVIERLADEHHVVADGRRERR